MIADPNIRAEIAQEWQTVQTLCRPDRTYVAGGPAPVIITEAASDEHYNLPLVLAYAVLDEVLDALIAQGVFSCKSWMLGAKMAASKAALPWQNYALVDQGKTARNDLAHEAKLADKAQCLKFVDAIELELKAWGVI